MRSIDDEVEDLGGLDALGGLPDLDRKVWIGGGLFVLMGCLCAIGQNISPGASSAGAQHACEQFTSDRLKAPSTAQFTGVTASKTGDKTYRVTGGVDSQNSFGATVRTEFSCQVKHEGDGWRLRDLNVSQ